MLILLLGAGSSASGSPRRHWASTGLHGLGLKGVMRVLEFGGSRFRTWDLKTVGAKHKGS